ncbi:ABC transporter permease [Halobellus salinus]|uniref:ABC transporter permease n=1 Tax=Halobellus salinus TaxID=931585 RepID=A0A830ERJ7_9EURY|nr:ABC transporter permease [Halobellus salinus]GGJ16951.1 ABC transporter permease [Halobellus salinus]SMP34376.1 peptide/nickel transport system permease protein [Halobellus salinus]
MSVETESYRNPSISTRLGTFAREFLTNPVAASGAFIVLSAILVSVFGPYLVTDPTVTDPASRFAAPSFLDPSSSFLLGADQYGRDILARVIVGGRSTILLGVSASALGLALGVPIGLLTGYLGGKVDEVVMRLMDALMSFPSLLLGLLILTTLSSSIWNAILAVGIAYFPRIARVVRSSTISVKNEEYVKAAEARGESTVSIIFREILPNVTSAIIVEGTIRVGFAMLVGSSLSFLGLGAQPPAPDWGYMVAQARVTVYQSPYFLLWPSLALAYTVTGFNLLGDGLRDILDPQTRSD